MVIAKKDMSPKRPDTNSYHLMVIAAHKDRLGSTLPHLYDVTACKYINRTQRMRNALRDRTTGDVRTIVRLMTYVVDDDDIDKRIERLVVSIPSTSLSLQPPASSLSSPFYRLLLSLFSDVTLIIPLFFSGPCGDMSMSMSVPVCL